MKRRIHTNVWGNTSAYLGRTKVYEFGCDETAAQEWLETGEWLTTAGGRHVNQRKAVLASVDIHGTVSYRPYQKGWYGGRYDLPEKTPTDTPAGR